MSVVVAGDGRFLATLTATNGHLRARPNLILSA
jgi:hypothetical protein